MPAGARQFARRPNVLLETVWWSWLPLATAGERGTWLVPELGLEIQKRLRGAPELNATVELSSPEIDLPALGVNFRFRG